MRKPALSSTAMPVRSTWRDIEYIVSEEDGDADFMNDKENITLETEQLVLRPLTPDDFETLHS